MSLLVAATLVYVQLEKSVTVRIEGEIRPVKTFALTVGDTLERAGIEVGSDDRVTPALGTRVAEGAQIQIVRAKPVTIVLNGKPREVVVTAMTVDEVLHQVALRSSMRDFVGASRSARVYPGMTIEYRQAVGLNVVHDEKTDRVITNAATVRQMLAELKIALGAKDKVQPGLDVYPTNGMTVKVLRVGERKETVERILPAPTQTKRSTSVEYGVTKVIQEGRPGLKVTRYLSTYEDGRRVKRKLLESKVVRKAQPKIVAIGTGFPSCPCNTGTESGVASWYDAYGLTAAHKTLPKGTVVKVTNLENGKSVNVVIRDRGPYVRGRIIDLSDNAFSRIASLGAGVVRVKITY
ncbi:MAG TPA: ubiquitin-like domain-containing protein [Actinomycetota bacterium]